VAVGAGDFGGVRVRFAAYTVTTSDGRPTAVRVFAVKQQPSATGGELTTTAFDDVAVPVGALTYGHTLDGAVTTLHAALPAIGVLDVRLAAPITGHGAVTSLHNASWNYNLVIDEGNSRDALLSDRSFVRVNGADGLVSEATWGMGASGYVRAAMVPTPA
jgi:hypothetical protein